MENNTMADMGDPLSPSAELNDDKELMTDPNMSVGSAPGTNIGAAAVAEGGNIYEDASEQGDGEDAASPAYHEKSNTGVVEGKASTKLTILLIFNNIIGGGILALPTAFMNGSPLVGTLVLLLTSAVTILNLYFITEASEHEQEFNYGLLLRKVLGENLAKVVLTSLVFFPYGILCLYQGVLSDAMPPVMISFLGADPDSFIATKICWLLIGSAVFILLSYRRYLADLLISSIFGMCAIIFSVLAVVIRWGDGSYSQGGRFMPANSTAADFEYPVAYVRASILKIIPVYAFSLAVHNNAAQFFSHLEHRSPARFYNVLGWAHFYVVGLYIIMGIAGYFTFGETRLRKVHGDILVGYDDDDALINVVRLAYFVVMVTSYPLLHNAARRGFNQLVFGPVELPMKTLVLECVVITGTSALIAGVIPSIETIMSMSGAIFGTVVVFVGPSLLYLKSVGAGFEWTKMKYAAVGSIIFGIVSGVLDIIITATE